MFNWAPLLIAVQFLTLIPVHLKTPPTARDNALSLLFYPLVGLMLALILFCVAKVTTTIPILVSSALLLTIWVIITGALHLDGLADSADAWMGGLGDRQRTLAIMKDPSCGPVAVVTLGIQLLLKFSLLTAVLTTHNWIGLILATVLARTAIPALFLTTNYVRNNGLGSQIKQAISPRAIRYLLLGVTLITVVISPIVTLMALLLLLVLRYFMERRLGGFTGDLAGAVIEILESTVLLFTFIF